MIEIRYDPFNGKAVPDGKTVEVVNTIIDFCQRQSGDKEPNFRKGDNTCFSTANMIKELRVAVKEGRINHNYIIFTYHIPGTFHSDREKIVCDEFGHLSQWPEGFCDWSINQCMKLC